MARRSIDLRTATDARWLDAVLGDFDAFLADHANCERKASVQAMSFVVKFPDRPLVLGPLIDLAQEELGHFR
ncbi:MAG: tRNA-(ms[2]io[6]A)-hydroxylase, partial [Myxococcales bacterium]|nr:tRNA-(ms[2]io[6]A)-hydroxylase [Myxococcales bacterium]